MADETISLTGRTPEEDAAREKKHGARRPAPKPKKRADVNVGAPEPLSMADGTTSLTGRTPEEDAARGKKPETRRPARSPKKRADVNVGTPEPLSMTEETISLTGRTPEEGAARDKKREARRMRDEIQLLRKQAREITAKRKELEEKYAALVADAGLPERKKRDRPKRQD